MSKHLRWDLWLGGTSHFTSRSYQETVNNWQEMWEMIGFYTQLYPFVATSGPDKYFKMWFIQFHTTNIRLTRVTLSLKSASIKMT